MHFYQLINTNVVGKTGFYPYLDFSAIIPKYTNFQVNLKSETALKLIHQLVLTQLVLLPQQGALSY